MQVPNIKFTFFALIVWLSFCNSFAVNLITTVDQNPIALGQSFHLIIDLKDEPLTMAPDLSALTPQLQILGISQNQQVSIINGKTEKKNQLEITLIPKQKGRFTIPAIKIGNNWTQAIPIEIKAAQQVNVGNKNSVFLKTDIDNKKPYIQSEVLYTVKLYYNISLSSSSLTPPVADDAIVKQLDEDLTYEAHNKGQLYHVFQRTYSIFPQKSGKVVITPPIFRAEVDTTNGRHFFNIDSQPIELVASQLSLDVKPKPGVAKGNWWLPAHNITLTENWSQNPNQVKQGQPITRSIQIKAEGLTAAQLPNLNLNGNRNNVNSYPAQPKLEDTLLNHHILGTRTEKVVYIPTNSGQLILPEIKIHWWNTKSNQNEVAVISSKKLTVVPVTSKAQKPSISNLARSNSTPKNLIASNQKAMAEQSSSNIKFEVVKEKKSYLTLFIVALLALIIISLIYLYRYKNKSNKCRHCSSFTKIGQIKKHLRKACLQANPAEAKESLIAWAQRRWPEKGIRNLEGIASLHLSQELTFAIMDLNKQLYAGENGRWNGRDFWILFKNLKLETGRLDKKAEESLPDLYLT